LIRWIWGSTTHSSRLSLERGTGAFPLKV
jgi:hypothetical protein